MKAVFGAAVGLAAGMAGFSGAWADETAPVVVELFTSQGCSSCPPADEILAELADRDDVIALALHVDYWDYLGWKDEFADPAFTKRQKSYARAAGARTVYTPQMVIGGTEHIVGVRPMELMKEIERAQASPDPVHLVLARVGDDVSISIAGASTEPAVVQLVRYLPSATVEIRGGENDGRDITYHNIVESWSAIGEWAGTGNVSITAPAPGDLPVVVIVQEPGPGAILAAARLR